MASATFTYVPSSGATKVVIVRAPEWGNKDRTDPQQKVTRTRGGTLYVYQSGPRIRQLELAFDNLNAQERADLEDFFDTGQANWSGRWFYLTLNPNEREVLVAGALVGGAPILAGTTYKAGQRILMDTIQFPVRLVSAVPVFDEPGPTDGLFHLDMTVEVLGNLPDNS